MMMLTSGALIMAEALFDSGLGDARDHGVAIVDVCVCTFRRRSLEATLLSLAAQDLTPKGGFRIIVADNDDTPTAQSMAEQTATSQGLNLLYIHAPAHNISVARNACLEAVRAPFVAFIDDDEEASSAWLRNLMSGLEETDADVVFGPVRAVYGEDAPAWVRKADLHSIRPTERAGGRIETGYSCNVLMRRQTVGELRFDPALGRSGGEDTQFFFQMTRRGARLAFRPDAWTTEIVPPHRARLGWLLRRSYGAGQAHARTLRASSRNPWLSAAAASAKAAYCGAGAILNLLSPARRSRSLVRGALHVGVVGSLLGGPDLELY
jgi:succinoglycan biosynthesis protein ExoM